MLGAIYGDIVGSRFEFTGFNEYDFLMFHPSCRFTDDTLMTLAVALTLVVTRNNKENYQNTLIRNMKDIAHKHPNVGWGKMFHAWLFKYKVPVPLNSYGNGSAMRISPVGWVCDTVEETIELSKLTTEITHNHPESTYGLWYATLTCYPISGFIKTITTRFKFGNRHISKFWIIRDHFGFNLFY